MTQETGVLTQDEVDALLGQCNTRTPTGARNYALLQLVAQTGIRCGEALAVTRSMIGEEEWGGRRLWVLRLPRRATKGQRPRDPIPLTPATVTALQRWQEKRAKLVGNGGPLFCTVSKGQAAGFGEGELCPGQPLDGRYVRSLVARLAAKAGIGRRVHPHMLRHTCLTQLYDRTRNLRLVQEVAGHSSSRHTERYTHIHPVAVAEG